MRRPTPNFCGQRHCKDAFRLRFWPMLAARKVSVAEANQVLSCQELPWPEATRHVRRGQA